MGLGPFQGEDQGDEALQKVRGRRDVPAGDGVEGPQRQAHADDVQGVPLGAVPGVGRDEVLPTGDGTLLVDRAGLGFQERAREFELEVLAGQRVDLIRRQGAGVAKARQQALGVETAEGLGYKQLIVSLKASHVPTAVACYTEYASKADYPTHVGITEAGSKEYGTLKSAAGIGAILLRGIGDTIRVSLLGDPVPEIEAGFDILRACDRRVTKPEVVACPTCGRLDIDLERIVAEVEEKMKHLSNPLRISILGCLVNGFGEAKEADLGIAAGSGKGIIFKRGVPIRHVKEAEMVEALLEEVARFDEEVQPLASFVEKEKRKQAKPSLPVLN